jgi:hypothetical protein
MAHRIPILKQVRIGESSVPTGIIACVDKAYPYLADIVRQAWEKGYLFIISSANKTGQPTNTDPYKVWEDVKDILDIDVMVLDNPALRKAYSQLDDFEPASYTIAQFATGWDGKVLREGRVPIHIMRQGNVGPGIIYQTVRPHIDHALIVSHSPGLNPSQVLVREPYFNLTRQFPPDILKSALGFPE